MSYFSLHGKTGAEFARAGGTASQTKHRWGNPSSWSGEQNEGWTRAHESDVDQRVFQNSAFSWNGKNHLLLSGLSVMSARVNYVADQRAATASHIDAVTDVYARNGWWWKFNQSAYHNCDSSLICVQFRSAVIHFTSIRSIVIHTSWYDSTTAQLRAAGRRVDLVATPFEGVQHYERATLECNSIYAERCRTESEVQMWYTLNWCGDKRLERRMTRKVV